MSNLFPYFSGIRWQDIVDIILNSYILFRLYILFRGTNAFQMLIGIAFLWFFQQIATSLGLIVTSWAIQGITAVTALIIVVVFSREIRSVFHAKNLKAILWEFPVKANLSPVEIISESVFEMGKKHCGALIVFPGKESLKDIVKNGVPWHGVISKEMINTIFWHNNPVHDGAVIIQGNRITEVSAILPLSPRTDLPSYYGTRHRAAIGLTELTDAMVIAVSEERGIVTVAKHATISVMHDKKELEQKILEHVGWEGNHQGYISYFLRKKNMEPFIAALISVFFITGIWFGVTSGLDTLITFEATVEYMNRDPAMEILKTSANNVRLHVSGSDVLVKSVRPEQIRVKVDMSKATEGKNVFTLTHENINLPPGILLTKIDPAKIEVEIDTPVSKVLPIQADWIGKLPEKLIMESVKLYPEKVRLMGTNRILKDISTAYTERISLDKIEKSGKITAGLIVSPPNFKVDPNSKDKVTIEYVIKEKH